MLLENPVGENLLSYQQLQLEVREPCDSHVTNHVTVMWQSFENLVNHVRAMYSSLLQVATLLKMYVRHQLYLYEEAMGGGLRMVPASMKLDGHSMFLKL